MSVNNSFQKNANLSLIAHRVWKQPGISRIDIARELDLYRSSVGNLITILVDQGLIREGKTGSSQPQGGRKPISLHINPGFACALGLEIQPDRWVARLVDLQGNVLLAKEGESDSGCLEESFDGIIANIEPEIRSFGSPLLGICVGLPGIVNVDRGVIAHSRPLGLSDYDFRQRIASRYRIPIQVENDANCCAWRDLTAERGDASSNYISVLAECHRPNPFTGNHPGIAVGLGLALGGKLYYGSSHAAGEFMGGFRDGPDVSDGFMRELLECLLPLVVALDPDTVFFHGILSDREDRVTAIAANDVPAFARWIASGHRRMLFPKGPEPVAIGSAALFLQRLFSVPELGHGKDRADSDWERVFSIAERLDDPWVIRS